MASVREAIEARNERGEKALSIFVTSGFPNPSTFVDDALRLIDAGADVVELGAPFSDPLADGPVIQKSSHAALERGVTLRSTLEFAENIRAKSDVAIALMGYANPILKYGVDQFAEDAKNAGVAGLIVPDVSFEEYDDFFTPAYDGLETVLLTTPVSSEERTRAIDEKSRGFVYCVSVTGVTGARGGFSEETIAHVRRVYETVKKNKTLVGFGVSGAEGVRAFKPVSDGVIVGSAIVKRLADSDLAGAEALVRELRAACDE
jgi:tryptophan synthase alpha chain